MASHSASHPQDPVQRALGDSWGAFLAAAVRSPRDVGTLLPSGPELAQRLAAVVAGAGQAGRPAVIVEVGAGGGAVTADASTLPAILADHGVDRADVIVSVLPWSLFGPQQQREFLKIFAAALQDDGVFTAAAYSLGYWTPAARRFRGELQRTFGEVLPTRTLWRHLPPAMTYVCRHPDVTNGDITADPNR